MIHCADCKHVFDRPGVACKAFPDGIPFAIQSGQVDHRKPYKGDNGIRFEPIESET